ncbi:unnamed protein product [Blepharisma stoltei]|uniref:Uncharacterized protein n=1 Tax=Blepharisma stoltei TaxID=1481888 RepID=A0AAU9IRB9_9CILI|nr:unnamed protein product [Blepharisma stoltei]
MIFRRHFSALSRDLWTGFTKKSAGMTEISKFEVNLGDSKRLGLYGMPRTDLDFEKQEEEPLLLAIADYKPSIILLQIDPMHYMKRFRHIEQEFAKRDPNNAINIQERDLENPAPNGLNEIEAGMEVIDVVKMIETGKKIDLNTALSNIRAVKSVDEINEKSEQFKEYSEAILAHILGNMPMKFPYMTPLLVFSLYNQNEIALIDMPEPLLRMHIANKYSLEELTGIAAQLVEGLNDHFSTSEKIITLENIAYDQFPQIFQYPRDIYIASVHNEYMKENDSVVSFVNNPTYLALPEIWKEADNLSFKEACQIPPKIPEDTNEILIEKHALLDVILETNIWASKYTKNPFPYIGLKSEITPEDKQKYKEIFKQKYFQYQQFVEDRLRLPDSIKKLINKV